MPKAAVLSLFFLSARCRHCRAKTRALFSAPSGGGFAILYIIPFLPHFVNSQSANYRFFCGFWESARQKAPTAQLRSLPPPEAKPLAPSGAPSKRSRSPRSGIHMCPSRRRPSLHTPKHSRRRFAPPSTALSMTAPSPQKPPPQKETGDAAKPHLLFHSAPVGARWGINSRRQALRRAWAS